MKANILRVKSSQIDLEIRENFSLKNNLGSSEIWDKYHECCIENGTNFMRRSQVKLPISNTARVVFITVIPMLFHVNIILADFCWCFHVRDVQIALQKHVTLIGATL